MADLPGLPLPLSGKTRVFAILGDPIAQAGSPRLFNSAFRGRSVEAVLVPFHVAPPDLPAIVTAFRRTKNFDGLVLTVPHQLAAFALVEETGDMARRIGAVNVIRKQNGQLFGDNFDGFGFTRGLSQKGHGLLGRRVLIVGAGGAGRAVAHAILDEKPAAIRLFDVDDIRLNQVVAELRGHSSGTLVEAGQPDPAAFDVVVNCTSIGMKPEHPYPIMVENLNPSTLVADIILEPETTPLLKAAESRGCITQSGIHMLLGQVDAICDFFGV